MLADRCRVFYQKRHRRERVTWTVLQSIFEMIITMVSSIFVDLTKIAVSKIGKFVDNDSLNTVGNEKCDPNRGSTQQQNPRILVFNQCWWNHLITAARATYSCPRFCMIKYQLFYMYLCSAQGSITLIIKSLKIIIDVIVSHIWIVIISSNLVHTIIR